MALVQVEVVVVSNAGWLSGLPRGTYGQTSFAAFAGKKGSHGEPMPKETSLEQVIPDDKN
jgi:hypothetical protein